MIIKSPQHKKTTTEYDHPNAHTMFPFIESSTLDKEAPIIVRNLLQPPLPLIFPPCTLSALDLVVCDALEARIEIATLKQHNAIVIGI